jgi:amino acid permease
VSAGGALFLSLLMALSGYLSFMETTQANVLHNLPPSGMLPTAARLLLGVTMMLTYPLENYVARYALTTLLASARPQARWGRRGVELMRCVRGRVVAHSEGD